MLWTESEAHCMRDLSKLLQIVTKTCRAQGRQEEPTAHLDSVSQIPYYLLHHHGATAAHAQVARAPVRLYLQVQAVLPARVARPQVAGQPFLDALERKSVYLLLVEVGGSIRLMGLCWYCFLIKSTTWQTGRVRAPCSRASSIGDPLA